MTDAGGHENFNVMAVASSGTTVKAGRVNTQTQVRRRMHNHN